MLFFHWIPVTARHGHDYTLLGLGAIWLGAFLPNSQVKPSWPSLKGGFHTWCLLSWSGSDYSVIGIVGKENITCSFDIYLPTSLYLSLILFWYKFIWKGKTILNFFLFGFMTLDSRYRYSFWFNRLKNRILLNSIENIGVTLPIKTLRDNIFTIKVFLLQVVVRTANRKKKL